MCDFCGGDFGGAGGCYNTPMNTLGVGDLVPAGTTEYGNDFKQMQFGKPASKRPAQYQNSKKNQPKQNSGFDFTPRPLYVPYGKK